MFDEAEAEHILEDPRETARFFMSWATVMDRANDAPRQCSICTRDRGVELICCGAPLCNFCLRKWWKGSRRLGHDHMQCPWCEQPCAAMWVEWMGGMRDWVLRPFQEGFWSVMRLTLQHSVARVPRPTARLSDLHPFLMERHIRMVQRLGRKLRAINRNERGRGRARRSRESNV